MSEFMEIAEDFVSEIVPVILFCMFLITVLLFLFTFEFYLVGVGVVVLFVAGVFKYAGVDRNVKKLSKAVK